MRSLRPTAVLACAIGASATHASAQAFSIDFGFQSGVPGIGFGGASTPDAPQAGTWLIPTTDGNVIDFNGLFDTDFVPTDVHLRSDRALNWINNPQIGGDPDLVGLVADGITLGGASFRGSGPVTLTLDGIANGEYEIITYTAPFLDFTARVSVEINGETRIGGGDFPSLFFVEGVTHTRHHLAIDDNLLTMRYETVSGQGVINGFQIIPIPTPSTLALMPFLGLTTRRRR